MTKLLFVNKDASSLGSNTGARERYLIQSHVQAKRPHVKRKKQPIKPTSARPKYLEFRHKSYTELDDGSIIMPWKPIDEREDEQKPLRRPQAQAYIFPPYILDRDDWTSEMVPLRGEQMIEVRQHMRHFWSQHGVLRHIVPMMRNSPELLTSFAYLACSNLDALKLRKDSASSLIVKGKAVRYINDSLSKNASSVPNLTAVACIATSINEIGLGLEYLVHNKGVETMFTLANQKKRTAQPVTMVEKLLNRLVGIHRFVMPCVFNLELDIPDYPDLDYSYDDESVSLDETFRKREIIAESPFYCPTTDYVYLQTATYSTPRTMQLLRDIRDYRIVLETERRCTTSAERERVLVRRLSLRTHVLSYNAVHGNVDHDIVYEIIRLTCLALIHLSDTCLPARVAFGLVATTTDGNGVREKLLKSRQFETPLIPPVTHTALPITSPRPSQIISQLAYNLRKGPNPVIGWSPAMEGVLYWIITIASSIARARPEYRLFSSIHAKTLIDMAASADGRTWDEGFVPIRTFISFQQMCLQQEITKLVDIEDV